MKYALVAVAFVTACASAPRFQPTSFSVHVAGIGRAGSLIDGPAADDIQKQTAAIPHHETKLLPHTHHFVMFDDPKATFAAIDAFLTAHP
jgi:hypothetical protein